MGSIEECFVIEMISKFRGTTFVINDRVNVINHKTGLVCLSMSQWNMGSMVKFYTFEEQQSADGLPLQE